jgi:aerobic carbon-monoxide dehydrogenase large subunit
MRPTKFGVGQSVKRVEDVRLVSGRGNYASDAVDKAELKAVFLRSPYGHAKFRIDDIEAARAAPGVRAVYVASDFSDLGGLPCLAPVPNADKSKKTPLKPYPVMASDEAHHVGDIVAMVVADTTLEARDAAELISVTWEELPAAIDTE